MSHATLSAPDMSVIGHHVWVGGQFQERRTNVLSSGVASLAPGVAPSACQVLGFVEACLGRFLSCCCVFVFCLLRCDSAQGEVRAACVVPVDPG